MTRKDGASNPIEAVAAVITIFVFGPIFVILGLAAIFEAISPYLPLIVIGLLAGGIGLATYWYQTSPFTVRRQHEREVLDLLARAEEQQRQLPADIAPDAIVAALRDRVDLPDSLLADLAAPAFAVYREEFRRLLPPMPPVPLEPEKIYDVDYDRRTLKKGEEPPHRERRDARGRPTTLALEEFKSLLHRFIAATADPVATVAAFAAAWARLVGVFAARLPPVRPGVTTPFSVPLIDFLPDPGAVVVAALAAASAADPPHKQHLSSLRDGVAHNLAALDLDVAELSRATDRATIEASLAGTALAPLLGIAVPFDLPPAKRFEGHWIVARQGSGKTNTLECLIAADLSAVIAGRASLLVMDSQGIADDTLLGRLSQLRLFAPGQPLADRLIYLEPDLDFPLALNIFDIGLAAMGQLSASQYEDIVTSATEVVEFLFTGLLGGELSDNMTMLYKYLVPAMLVIPGADMNTFIELLDSDSRRDRPVPAGYAKYRAHFAALDPDIRSFLESDYLKDPELAKTKAAVRRRLRAAMADTTFRRMFMQPRNKLDLFSELQSGKVILVNTYPAKSYVEPFGRLILALLMQATHQRLAIDRDRRLPTYVYLDECQDYIAREERIARYIDKCRKQNVGLIFANQRLGNIENPKVRNALSGVAIKFAGSSDADDADLANLAVTTPDRIRQLPKGSFAAYVSGITPRGIDLKVPLSPLAEAPRMSREAWAAIRRRMRDRYAVPFVAHGQTSRSQPAAADTSEPQPPHPRDGPVIEGTATRIVRRSLPPADDDYDPLQ